MTGRTKACLLVLLAIAFMATAPAIGKAATLGLTFDNTTAGAGTGSLPFDADDDPGNDSTGTNHIVRTNDIITYRWGVSSNEGSSPNTTLVQTLPVGMTWASLPAYCLAGGTPPSGLTDGDRTITCNLGNIPSGSAANYYPIAKVGGNFINGDTLTTDVTVTSSDPATLPITSDEIIDTISAEPRVDLTKDFVAPQSDGCNFTIPSDPTPTWGQCILYPMSLVIEAINGKGSRGNEVLAQPLSWVDDLTGSPNAYLVNCAAANYSYSQPLSNYFGGNPPISIQNSGSVGCTQPGGQGGNINVTVSGADLTGQHIPTDSQGSGPLPANLAFLGQYYVRVFVPQDDIPVSGGLELEDTLTGFNPSGRSPDGGVTPGTPNFGGDGEPTENNSADAAINREDPGPGIIAVDKCLYPQGQDSCAGGVGGYSDNQTVAPGQNFWAVNLGGISGDLATPRAAVCDLIDTTTQTVSLDGTLGGPAGQAAWVGSSSVGGTVQYGTGGVVGHDTAAWNQTRTENCDDASSPAGWFNDPTLVPGGLGAITKVRLIASAPTAPPAQLKLVINMKALNLDPTDSTPLPTGTIIADFLNGTANFNTGTGTGEWFTNVYNPLNGGGEEGKRVVLTRANVRISKDTVPAGKVSASTGELYTYRLQPTISGDAGGTVTDVIVRDTIPNYLTYQVGSASPAPATVAPGPGGTTVLTWNLGDLPVGVAVPPLTYDVRVKLSAPNGANAVNTTVISSPDDPVAQENRTASHTVAISKISGLIIIKSTTTPWVEPHDDLEFVVEYANNSAIDLDSMDSIDVLPYNGDGRGTTFSGTLALESVTVNDGETVYYTSAAPGSISNNPKAASNALPAGSTKWCLTAELGTGGCPATVAASTGVRVINPVTVLAEEVNSYSMTFNTNGNESGDQYINDAGLAGEGVSLPAFSQPVVDEVVSSSLGDYVWNDLNRNGLQDNDEPGVDDLEVTLTGTDKNGDAVSRNTTTAGGGLYRFDDLISGEYEITFTKPAGYSFTIEEAGSDPTLDSNANLTTGETGTITIDSPVPLQADQEDLGWDAGIIADEGRITIIKDAVPDADVDFGFSATGGITPSSFVLNDDGDGTENTRTFTVPGDGSEYEFTETVTSGWDLTGIVCTGSAQTDTEVSSGRARMQVGPGETATCTFTNTKQVIPPDPTPSSITIIKQANPEGDTRFAFTTTNGLAPGNAFGLTDDGTASNTVTYEVPGDGSSYTVKESGKNGWDLTKVTCTGTASTATSVPNANATITVGDGQTATCTFFNGKQATPVIKPNLVLNKTGSKKKAKPGAKVRYEISVRNTRKGSIARNLRICDKVPAHMTVVTRGGAALDNGKLCWRIAELVYSPRAKTFSYVMRIDKDAKPGTKLRNVVVMGSKKAHHTVRVTQPPNDAGGIGPAGVTG